MQSPGLTIRFHFLQKHVQDVADVHEVCVTRVDKLAHAMMISIQSTRLLRRISEYCRLFVDQLGQRKQMNAMIVKVLDCTSLRMPKRRFVLRVS